MDNFIKFLGTGGARIVLIKQIRHTGGIWFSLGDCQLHVDPGPGALIRVLASRKPKLDPSKLDAIILSHKHLDHCADINVMIEAMTEGGFKKRGLVICPEDAVSGNDAVIFNYIRSYPQKIEIINENKSFKIKKTEILFPIRHIHGDVLTYGVKFLYDNKLTIGYITDTKYFLQLQEAYANSDILIINVLRQKKSEELDHLSLEEAKLLIKAISPKLAILNHFGMTMLKAKPNDIAQALSEELKMQIISATDGMYLPLDELI
jgi:ribonuclease BN (tRNA processing enzyme)